MFWENCFVLSKWLISTTHQFTVLNLMSVFSLPHNYTTLLFPDLQTPLPLQTPFSLGLYTNVVLHVFLKLHLFSLHFFEFSSNLVLCIFSIILFVIPFTSLSSFTVNATLSYHWWLLYTMAACEKLLRPILNNKVKGRITLPKAYFYVRIFWCFIFRFYIPNHYF